MTGSRTLLSILVLLFAASLFVCPSTVNGQEKDYQSATTALNVRLSPSTSGTKLFVLQAGDVVKIGWCSGGWCRVTLAGKGSGWVVERYLSGGAPQRDGGPEFSEFSTEFLMLLHAGTSAMNDCLRNPRAESCDTARTTLQVAIREKSCARYSECVSIISRVIAEADSSNVASQLESCRAGVRGWTSGYLPQHENGCTGLRSGRLISQLAQSKGVWIPDRGQVIKSTFGLVEVTAYSVAQETNACIELGARGIEPFDRLCTEEY